MSRTEINKEEKFLGHDVSVSLEDREEAAGIENQRSP